MFAGLLMISSDGSATTFMVFFFRFFLFSVVLSYIPIMVLWPSALHAYVCIALDAAGRDFTGKSSVRYENNEHTYALYSFVVCDGMSHCAVAGCGARAP